MCERVVVLGSAAKVRAALAEAERADREFTLEDLSNLGVEYYQTLTSHASSLEGEQLILEIVSREELGHSPTLVCVPDEATASQKKLVEDQATVEQAMNPAPRPPVLAT